MAYRLAALDRYLRGWMNYFGISQYYRPTLSKTLATQTGMTNQWLAEQGLLSVRDLWLKAQGYA